MVALPRLLTLWIAYCASFSHGWVQRPSILREQRHVHEKLHRLPQSPRPFHLDHRLMAKGSDNESAKFGVGQRIESLKCLVIGAIVGSFALAPFALIHDVFLLGTLAPISTNGVAQWEFDNDMASLVTGLFAIVYRYCVREDENPQLNQGVIGAFVVTRTLSRIVVPAYCTAITLDCGAPLGYFDWTMLGQVVANGAESVAMFGATAAAIDAAIAKGWLSKFPG